jgi:putative ABC transport system permease protein
MRLYRALLHLYPASWRAEYAAEMCAVFARRRREASGILARLALWAVAIADILTTAPAVQWDVTRQDLRYAARSLRHSPGFALTAVAMAAMGIGTATAAFTILDHVLIRPLNFRQPERLLVLFEDHSRRGNGRHWDASPATYRDWKRMSTSFEQMAAYRGLSVNLADEGEPERIEGASVTGEMFSLLGATPALGRAIGPEDDRESAPATVVLSYGLWMARFGGTAAALGRTILFDGHPYTIIGVMPPDFYFPDREARIWTAMRWSPEFFADRLNTYIFGVGRLRRGVRLEDARAEMNGIAAQIARAFPKEMERIGVTVEPLKEAVATQSVLLLKVLMAAAGCVLLIACANLAGMLLARAMTRRRELAVRTALGAGRERLVRHMLTESLLLAWGGAALGIVLARAALPLLARLVPTDLPIAAVPSIDGRVLAFAVLLTCVTGVVFGCVPALHAGSMQPATDLAAGRSASGARRQRTRTALVIAEIAGSIVLLVSAGLLTRALWRVQAVDPGFRADHILTMTTSLPMPKYEHTETREVFYRRVLADTRQLPGVRGAAYISFLPVVWGGGVWAVEIAGRPQPLAERGTACLRFVTPGYFAAMRIPLLAGRDVAESDTMTAPYVAVVSASFARRYWPAEDPLGRHIEIGNHDRRIVGVVGEVRMRGREYGSDPQIYGSWQQLEGDVATWYAPKSLVVRTAGDPAALAPALRRIIHAADPAQPVSDVHTMEEVLQDDTAPRRTQLDVLGAFALMAFLLAAAGIHGLLAFAVSTRTQEIGIRVALGARPGAIAGMLLKDALRLAAIGVAAGCAAGYAAGTFLQSLLAGVSPHDPAVFTAAALMAMAMVVLGGLWPSLRALRVNPVTAIRAE